MTSLIVSIVASALYTLGVFAGLIALLRGKLAIVGSLGRTLQQIFGWPIICLIDLARAALGMGEATFDGAAPDEQRRYLSVSAGAGVPLLFAMFAAGWVVGAMMTQLWSRR